MFASEKAELTTTIATGGAQKKPEFCQVVIVQPLQEFRGHMALGLGKSSPKMYWSRPAHDLTQAGPVASSFCDLGMGNKLPTQTREPGSCAGVALPIFPVGVVHWGP